MTPDDYAMDALLLLLRDIPQKFNIGRRSTLDAIRRTLEDLER